MNAGTKTLGIKINEFPIITDGVIMITIILQEHKQKRHVHKTTHKDMYTRLHIKDAYTRLHILLYKLVS